MAHWNNKAMCISVTNDLATSTAEEAEIKTWRREKKSALVESVNPRWRRLRLIKVLSKKDLSLTLEMTKGCSSASVAFEREAYP